MNEQQSRIYKHSMKLERRTASLFVQNVGCQQCSPGLGWGPGIRNHFLLHQVISGRGTYICREKRYELEAGDAFLVTPNTIIQYYADQEEPWEYVWVGFGGLDAVELMAQTVFTPEEPVLRRGEHSRELEALLRGVYEQYGSAQWQQLAMTAQLYQLLAFLVRGAGPKAAARQAQRDCAQAAAEYIVAHYEEPISVEWLAEHTAVSHSSLYRRFVKRFQMSPKRFLLEYRVERACHLLETTDFSVQEVSNSVGFEDPFYFSRAFKEIKGLSPRQYANAKKRDREQQ